MEQNNLSEIKERVVAACSSSTSTSRQTISGNARLTLCSGSDNWPFPVPRTHANWNFHRIARVNTRKEPFLKSELSITCQESALLYELLYFLVGVRGDLITTSYSDTQTSTSLSFAISNDVSQPLREIAMEILPLASYHQCMQEFLEKAQIPNAGSVVQALSAAVKNLVHDYYLLISMMEKELYKNNLTLHKLNFYLRPTIQINKVIAEILTKILQNDLRGAAVLTLLQEHISSLSGAQESQAFIVELMEQASKPYMQILAAWVQKGVIDDADEEFLVEDNELIRREKLPEHYSADYWEKRYTIRHDRVPCFLQQESEMILRTGKYLNVIQQCGEKVMPTHAVNINLSALHSNHVKIIESAYEFASKTLLDVLIKNKDLMGHLMSVKRYLLLNQGDFIMQLMDACEEELSKNVDHVLPMALENLLGLTLRLSSARNDLYKDDLHCELLTYDLVTQMSKIIQENTEEKCQTDDRRIDLTGLECFAFSYEVRWPISLLLNHITISKYQMLFRQLFYCKHIERQLSRIWKENSIAKKWSSQTSQLYRSAFTLRHRMIHAIQNFEYYMMIEVIEPNWHTFIEKMKKVGNVDEVLALHQDFLDSCLRYCMLITDTTLLSRSIFRICRICLKFCEFMQTMETIKKPKDSFAKKVQRFEVEFTAELVLFLKQITEVAAANSSDLFMNLVHRINFNYFYTPKMEEFSCSKSK